MEKRVSARAVVNCNRPRSRANRYSKTDKTRLHLLDRGVNARYGNGIGLQRVEADAVELNIRAHFGPGGLKLRKCKRLNTGCADKKKHKHQRKVFHERPRIQANSL